MEEIYWECFFNNAGINSVSSKEYSLIFVKNKISDALLEHLNEKYLKSMGIDAVGDIIRILKYSKDFIDDKKKSQLKNKEMKDRNVEIVPVKVKANEEKPIIKKVTPIYHKPPGCEVPVAVKRFVTPEIEGRYTIKYPNKSRIVTESKHKETEKSFTSNRIVILNDVSYSKTERKTSALKRLGKSIEISSSSDEDKDEMYKESIKKQKIKEDDDRTLSKRFSKHSLIKNTNTYLSKNDKLDNIIYERTVFSRLGESTRYIDLDDDYEDFVDLKSSNQDERVKVRSGHTTEHLNKVEATSTTETGSLRSDFLTSRKQTRNILSRLGSKL